MRALFVILLAFAIPAVWGEPYDFSSLSVEAFNGRVNLRPFMVEFMAPWCGACKQFSKEWETFANQYPYAAKVDCTLSKDLCNAKGIGGYPTLYFYDKGEHEPSIYMGQHTSAALLEFINGKDLSKFDRGEPVAKKQKKYRRVLKKFIGDNPDCTVSYDATDTGYSTIACNVDTEISLHESLISGVAKKHPLVDFCAFVTRAYDINVSFDFERIRDNLLMAKLHKPDILYWSLFDQE